MEMVALHCWVGSWGYLMIVIGCAKVSSRSIFDVPHVTPSFGEAVRDATVVCKLRILSPRLINCQNGLNRIVVPSIKWQ
ncbi:hypothetical protein M758_1G073600 [Ceratodon purpureus]|nr:hypothetical protein M758_1G073600 [Ceratodon purpureus]